MNEELLRARYLIDSNGELPAFDRKKILQLIEELSLIEHANAGYLRRARLAIICALKVLEKIAAYKNVQKKSESIISKGILLIQGEYDSSILEKENASFHTAVIELFEHGDVAFSAVYAGMTCFTAINTVLYDTNFDLIGVFEKNVSPDDWDVGYYGSLAMSGSAIWEKKGGEQERRDYWEWYLNSAIPMAWNIQEPLYLPNKFI